MPSIAGECELEQKFRIGWRLSVRLKRLVLWRDTPNEHPNDVFPKVVADGPVVDCKGLGHPLINERDCIRNDLRLDSDMQLLLVSGSNMSGKSTLLRSLGSECRLGSGGGSRACRVDAGFAAGRWDVDADQGFYTGWRVLHFFAELKRLRLIVDLADGQPPLLFLLDEILHGTNSHDRQVGSDGIIQRLLDHKAIGLVTTHDLALSEIADRMSSRARNVHFEDQLIDGRMTFDYQMRPGIVQKSNALSLMRSLGLDV